jgi:hypothetical protein
MIAELGDGHTRLTPPQPVDGGAPPAVLPVRFGITTDAIYIARAASGYEDLAGHRLTQVEGRSVETLRVDARSIWTHGRYSRPRTTTAPRGSSPGR